MNSALISIIIPTINEIENLSNLLDNIKKSKQVDNIEVVVVDGGSTDGTIEYADKYADLTISAQLGRASQLNAGAKVAQGKHFWFLHADSILDFNIFSQYLHVISSSDWGRFDIKINNPKLIYLLISSLINFRSRLSKIATGDQGIFISKELFYQVGKFPQLDLMEDVALSAKLKKHSSPFCSKLKIKTSARKWQKEGVLKTILLMWKLRLLYFFGVNTKTLARLYYK